MRILTIIAILFITCNLSAQQTDTIVNGYLSPIVRSGGSAPNFNFRGIFRNKSLSSNGFDSSNLELEILVSSDGKCYKLPVTNISTITNPLVPNTTIEGSLNDPSFELSTIPTGVAAIYEKTDSLKLMPFIENLPEDLQACMMNENFIILDSLNNSAGVESTVVRNDSVFIVSGEEEFYSGINSAPTLAFDSDRPILREPTVGTNIGGSSVIDWLEWHYFTAPTISLSQSPSTTVIEIGTETQYIFTATTTNTGGATLSNGHLFVVSGDTLDSYTSTTVGADTIDFTPLQTPIDTFDNSTYQFRATQEWVFGSESGTATSNTRTIRGVYPVLYGMVADTATAFADPYGTLTKLVQTEGNKTVSYTGSGLIVYGFPQTWSDTNLSSIIDPNGFNVTASFDRVTYPTVTSTGLTNNYTNVPYVFYFLNTGSTTTSGSNYTFNR